MKNLILITATLFLLVHTIGHSQTNSTEAISSKQETITKKDSTKTEVNNKDFFKGFIGTFMLEEADFELEILEEDNKLYIVTSFSKDILVPKNDTTLHELTRGVDLELIEGNPNALKFSQNGYVTTIQRVANKEEN